jgi:hypothetical protein
MDTCEEVIRFVVDKVGPTVCERAKNQIMLVENTNVDLSDIRLPVKKFVKDEFARSLIDEFELDKPENMIRFMVESFFGALEEINNAVNGLKNEKIHEIMGKILGAKRMVIYGIDNPNAKQEKFANAQNTLFNTTGDLEEQIPILIKEIRNIDNRSKWNFFIKARTSLETVDTDISLIKCSLDAMEDAVNLQIIISEQLGADIEGSVIKPYKEFYERLLDGDTCSLLHAYETSEGRKEGYFLKLSERPQRVCKLKTAYMDYIEEYENLEEYDNIQFE